MNFLERQSPKLKDLAAFNTDTPAHSRETSRQVVLQFTADTSATGDTSTTTPRASVAATSAADVASEEQPASSRRSGSKKKKKKSHGGSKSTHMDTDSEATASRESADHDHEGQAKSDESAGDIELQ